MLGWAGYCVRVRVCVCGVGVVHAAIYQFPGIIWGRGSDKWAAMRCVL